MAMSTDDEGGTEAPAGESYQHGRRGAEPKHDWDAIMAMVQGTDLPLTEIARRFGIADAQIHNRMRRKGIRRNREPLAQAVRAGMVRQQAAAIGVAIPQSIKKKDAAALVVATMKDVVARHQSQITAGQGLVHSLMVDLADVVANREDYEQAAVEETEHTDEDGRKTVDGRRRARLLRAISIPEHAQTVSALANALEKLVKLERQAWGVPDIPAPEPVKGPDNGTPEVIQTLRALSESIQRAASRGKAVDIEAKTVATPDQPTFDAGQGGGQGQGGGG